MYITGLRAPIKFMLQKCPQQNGGFIGPGFMGATTDQNLIAEQTTCPQ